MRHTLIPRVRLSESFIDCERKKISVMRHILVFSDFSRFIKRRFPPILNNVFSGTKHMEF